MSKHRVKILVLNDEWNLGIKVLLEDKLKVRVVWHGSRTKILFSVGLQYLHFNNNFDFLLCAAAEIHTRATLVRIPLGLNPKCFSCWSYKMA